MITLENNTLEFRVPEVHRNAKCSIDFVRTLRIPDDGREHYLPPGLSSFLRFGTLMTIRLECRNTFGHGAVSSCPCTRRKHCGSTLGRTGGYPFAVKIATGKICAVSGDSWVNHLNQDPQDYVVIPDQPWLDGYCVSKGVIRQFVAMPLGSGYSVEEQMTGKAEVGGIQVIAYPMKRERYEELFSQRRQLAHVSYSPSAEDASMGIAAGGKMRQEIYDDEYGLDAWDMRHPSRCFVTIANSMQWLSITGEEPPSSPPTAKEYSNYGLPWFDYYSEAPALEGAKKLKKIKGITEISNEKGESADFDEGISPG